MSKKPQICIPLAFASFFGLLEGLPLAFYIPAHLGGLYVLWGVLLTLVNTFAGWYRQGDTVLIETKKHPLFCQRASFVFGGLCGFHCMASLIFSTLFLCWGRPCGLFFPLLKAIMLYLAYRGLFSDRSSE